MAWEGSTRRQRLPDDWDHLRQHVLERDGWLCRIRGPHCTVLAREVDHIDPGDNHHPSNLQATCIPCHRAKTAAEATAARRRLITNRRRPTGKHPGML